MTGLGPKLAAVAFFLVASCMVTSIISSSSSSSVKSAVRSSVFARGAAQATTWGVTLHIRVKKVLDRHHFDRSGSASKGLLMRIRTHIHFNLSNVKLNCPSGSEIRDTGSNNSTKEEGENFFLSYHFL
jgi:hypothetical protein